MHMEEAHSCSSALIAGRVVLLKNRDADNRFSHKNQESWNYRSLSPTEEAKWDNILHHVENSSFPGKPSQFHQSKSSERTAAPSFSIICGLLAMWRMCWHCCFILQGKGAIYQSTQKTLKRLLPIQKMRPQEPMFMHHHTSCSQMLRRYLGILIKRICLWSLRGMVEVIMDLSGIFVSVTSKKFIYIDPKLLSKSHLSKFQRLCSTHEQNTATVLRKTP